MNTSQIEDTSLTQDTDCTVVDAYTYAPFEIQNLPAYFLKWALDAYLMRYNTRYSLYL